MYLITSCISLAALLWLLLGPYNDFRVDRLRQELFGLRDELFDRAASGAIGFDSSAYMATRQMLNGMIRFSHRLSFSRLATLVLLRRFQDPVVVKAFDDGLEARLMAAPVQDRELVARYRQIANVCLARHVLSSPVVIALVIPFVLLLVLRKLGIDVAQRLPSIFRSTATYFDRFAFKLGRAV